MVAEGFPRTDIQIVAGDIDSAEGAQRHKSLITRILDVFKGTDASEDEQRYYSQGIEHGGVSVLVEASEQKADEAASIMQSCGAESLHGENAVAPGDFASPSMPSAAAGQMSAERIAGSSDIADGALGKAEERKTIPVVEEKLQVGKRPIQHTVHVYSKVVETPVHENVTLREEHVNVERHPVNRPADEKDLSGMREGTIEVTETTEEPVIAKKARVVEEVVVGKRSTERTEQINDTVRRTQVDVEKQDTGEGRRGERGAVTAGVQPTRLDDLYTRHEPDFRKNFSTLYGNRGWEFNRYGRAYRFGCELSNDPLYRNKSWDEVESSAKQNWRDEGGITWEDSKDMIRYGYNRGKA